MPRLEPKELFEALLDADTEAQVVEILTDAAYWNDLSVWRPYGDETENWPTVGNQQSRPDHALVEKLTNAIDTKLIAAALISGIPIVGDDAPQTMAEARDLLFSPELKNMEELSKSITVAATGPATGRKQRPSLTIVDDGEGRTPASMPETILSLRKGKSNKGKIPFVQGKFNMGGSGVLEFCGVEHNVQLVLSRRNPSLLDDDATPEDRLWSFTLIRRQDPDPESPKSSKFVYLAPGRPDAEGRRGLLTFDAPTMRIFPERNSAYARDAKWGTLFKMYEYGTRAVTNMMLQGGLLMKMRLLLPEPALPIRFHECRPYGKESGNYHSGSYDTTMVGLINTLEQDRRDLKSQNVEWFDTSTLDIDGEKFTVRIYLFKKAEKRDEPPKPGKRKQEKKRKNPADNYRGEEGVLFTYNGQCQQVLEKEFFRRPKVNQEYLYNSLLVFVDCTQIGVRTHEKLFMANRENWRQTSLKLRLVRELEALIRDNNELERRAELRRRGEISDNPQTSKTFEKFIEDMVKRHPLLEQILGPGFRISNPFKPRLVETQEEPWAGKRFPTKFHFKGLEKGKSHTRDAHLDSKIRVPFDTDAEDDYFRRDDEPGEFKLYQIVDDGRVPAENWRSPPNLFEGTATLTITSLPPDAKKGDILVYEAEITDPSRPDPFLNRLTLVVQDRQKAKVGGKKPKEARKAPSSTDGKTTPNDTQLNVPSPQEVIEETWKEYDPEFTRMTAMRVKRAPKATEDMNVFDYFINMDNVFLNQAIKQQPRRTKELRDRFTFGMTMISLALIKQDMEKRRLSPVSEEDEAEGRDALPDVQAIVEDVTTALSPFLLPLVEALSSITGVEPLPASAGEAA